MTGDVYIPPTEKAKPRTRLTDADKQKLASGTFENLSKDEQYYLLQKKELTGLFWWEVFSVIILCIGAIDWFGLHNWHGLIGLAAGFAFESWVLTKKKGLQKSIDDYERQHTAM